MKKSLRILSLVLTIVMIMSSLTIVGSAYNAAYKGNDSSVKSSLKYDDVNSAVYTTEQYAEMALDEVDRMLDENAMVLDIYIGTLNISSIDGTLASVVSLYNSISSLLDAGLLGSVDSELLGPAVGYITGVTRSGGDTNLIYALLDLIGSLAPLGQEYVAGTASLGIVNGFISDYLFDVRELVYGLVIGLAGLSDDEDYDYMTDKTIPDEFYIDDSSRESSNLIDSLDLAQMILNSLVLGKWQKLDDLFYTSENTCTQVVYKDYIFHDGSASGAVIDPDTEALDTETYDYYGYVHPDWWVTYGLGDAIRVADGAAAPAASYTKVDLTDEDKTVYDLVENLLLQAYNGILVPVLNRITVKWLHEKMGYTFDETKTQEYVLNSDGSYKLDENEEKIRSSTYDYLYTGDAPENYNYSDNIFRIFSDDITVPRATVDEGKTFIESLNNIAGNFIAAIIKATPTAYTSGSNTGTTYTWTGDVNETLKNQTYSFTWVNGDNTKLVDNLCSALKFIIKVTDDEFFDESLYARDEVYDATTLDGLTNQQLLAYVLRSVINVNIPYIYIPDEAATQNLAGVVMQCVIQLAYQDIPQFTYTAPSISDYSTLAEYNVAVVQKSLAILMDIAAYNLNSVLDTEYTSATDSSYSPVNNGTTNNTGLISYLGDSGSYGTTAVKIAAWAVATWASTKLNGSEQCLLNIDFALDDQEGNYAGMTMDTVWSDLDALVNSIFPIDADNTSTQAPDNKPWISDEIASYNGSVVYNLLFNYIIYPVLSLDITNIQEIFAVNTNGAFNYDTAQTVFIDLLHRIFDLLFPDVFNGSLTSLNDIVNNTNLSGMVHDLFVTLSATQSCTSSNGTATITGRGKIIAGVALPIVCLVLGLSDKQEFSELESYLPETVAAGDGTLSFNLYNGSSGVNTSYRDTRTYAREVDDLYTYEITSYAANVVSGSGSITIGGISQGTTIAAGKLQGVTLNGLTNGQLIEFVVRYKVKDENGAYLNGGNELSLTSYCYVATEDKGDDEKLVTTTIGGYTVSYATDIYLASGDGLSDIEGYSIRVTDTNAGGTATTASATSASGTEWIKLSTKDDDISASLTHQAETDYALFPYSIKSGYTRTEYEYQKNADDEYVLNGGLKVPTALKTTDDVQVANGVYSLQTVINIGGATGTITTRVHIYEDYGLGSLVNSCISANRSTATLTSDTMWTPYYNALMAGISATVPPKTSGATFETSIGASGTGAAYTNNYATLYRNLYNALEDLKPYESSSSAEDLWTFINGYLSYNYTIGTYTANTTTGTTTVKYKDYIDYNESGYQYRGMRNYVAHTYKEFKSAINDANDLVNRQLKFIGTSADDYAEMTTAEKTAYASTVDSYVEEVDNASENTISPIEFAYAEHMIELTYGRLIATDGNKTKLASTIATFGSKTGSFSSGSLTAYNNAVTFANATYNDDSATAEQINEAMTQLIKAWKALEEGADYTEIAEVYTAEIEYIGTDLDEMFLNDDNTVYVDGAVGTEDYDETLLTAYLTAVRNAEKLIEDNANGEGLGVGDQDVLDNAVAAIATAKAALQESMSGGGSEESEATFELVEDAECEGTNTSYSPTINETVLAKATLSEDDDFTVTYEDQEVYLDGVLYGVPAGATADDIEGLFDLEGCSIEVTNTTSRGNVTTGTYVFIVDDETDEVLAAYIVAFRGDLDKNAKVNNNDASCVTKCLNDVEGYLYKDEGADEKVIYPAADVNGDGKINSNDKQAIRRVVSGYCLNQATGAITAE